MKKICIKILLFLFTIASSLQFLSSSVLASDETFKNIAVLKPFTIYHYDLDGDGKTETIYFEADEDAYIDTSWGYCNLYINNKLVKKVILESSAGSVMVADFKDNKPGKIILISMGLEDAITGKLVIGKYQNGNFKTIKTFNPNLFYSINKFVNKKDDGKFYIATEDYSSPYIGQFYYVVNFQLKDNKVRETSKTKIYQLTKKSASYKYKAKTAFNVYKAIGSAKTAYTVKKGDVVHITAYYKNSSGKKYYKVVNQNKKTGWIKFSDRSIFYEIPGWR